MKRQHYIYPLVIIGLLLSALVPFYASYGTITKDNTSSLFGEKILICTADGFRWIDISEFDSEEIPAPHSSFKCPACIVTAHDLTATLSSHFTIAAISWENIALSYNTQPIITSSLYISKKQAPRAPPYIT